MSQQLDFPSPINVNVGVSNVHLNEFYMNRGLSIVQIGVRGSGGYNQTFKITGQEATDLMITLNKANLTTESLQKRALKYLVTSGRLPAGSTVSGSVDS